MILTEPWMMVKYGFQGWVVQLAIEKLIQHTLTSPLISVAISILYCYCPAPSHKVPLSENKCFDSAIYEHHPFKGNKRRLKALARVVQIFISFLGLTASLISCDLYS